MQTSEIISVNLWQILISLANLVIIFLILKKFLFAPVQKMLNQRQASVDKEYAEAAAANEKAQQDQAAWEQKIATAEAEAENILKNAAGTARDHGDRLVADAKEKAEEILRQAQTDAELERRKAEETIKQEIVVVSTALAEKMLEREVNAADHQGLIDSFLEEIGHE